MKKVWLTMLGLGALGGCGHEASRSYGFAVGVYAGTAVLLPGATPACSSVADPNTDACCDDSQAIALSVALYSDGYYVDAWPAAIDASGRLFWQESFDTSSDGCAIAGTSNETLTQSLVYSYAAVTTQSCGTSTQSIQCAYSGPLRLQ